MKEFRYYSVSILLILFFIVMVKSSEEIIHGYKNEAKNTATCEDSSICIENKDIENVKEGSSCSCKAGRSTTQKPNIEKKVRNVSAKTNLTPENIAFKYERKYNMVLINGGVFKMGSDKPVINGDGEGPARKVSVSSFYTL